MIAMIPPLLVIALCATGVWFWTNLTADYDTAPPVVAIEVRYDETGEQVITYGQRITPLDTDWARDLSPHPDADEIDWARRTARFMAALTASRPEPAGLPAFAAQWQPAPTVRAVVPASVARQRFFEAVEVPAQRRFFAEVA